MVMVRVRASLRAWLGLGVTYLRVVDGAARRAGGCEAASAVAQPVQALAHLVRVRVRVGVRVGVRVKVRVRVVQALAHLAPDAIGTDEHVGIGMGTVGERGAHAAPVAELLEALDARLDAHL
eukprot:scaffold9661_cov36-Phaeocystis_antarctica.AAC.1